MTEGRTARARRSRPWAQVSSSWRSASLQVGQMPCVAQRSLRPDRRRNWPASSITWPHQAHWRIGPLHRRLTSASNSTRSKGLSRKTGAPSSCACPVPVGPLLAHLLQCLVARLGRGDRVAAVVQHVPHESPDRRIVLYHEHVLACWGHTLTVARRARACRYCSAIATLAERVAQDAQRLERGREPRVAGDLEQRLTQLVGGPAQIERAAQVGA